MDWIAGMKEEFSQPLKKRSFWIVPLTALVLTLGATVIANAGEDRTYAEDEKAICERIERILIEQRMCLSTNDCDRRKIFFCSPAIKGIGIQLWGIYDYAVIGPTLQAAAAAFARRNGEMRVYFTVYENTKQEALSKPFWALWPFKPKVAEFVFRGSN